MIFSFMYHLKLVIHSTVQLRITSFLHACECVSTQEIFNILVLCLCGTYMSCVGPHLAISFMVIPHIAILCGQGILSCVCTNRTGGDL